MPPKKGRKKKKSIENDGEGADVPEAEATSAAVPKLSLAVESVDPEGGSSPRQDLTDVSAGMMSPRAGTDLLKLEAPSTEGNFSKFDVAENVVDNIAKVESFPDQLLLSHGHLGDPAGAADEFATLSVVSVRGKHVALEKHQLGPLLRNSFSLSALCLVPPGPDATANSLPEYVAWSQKLSSFIHFKLHGAGGPVQSMQCEELGKFPVPFPRFNPPPEIASDPDAVAAMKPRHRPLAVSLYRADEGQLFAVYHSPGGDLKHLDSGDDGAGYGDSKEGLKEGTGVGLWIARVRLVRNAARNNCLRFDPSLVPSFGMVDRVPGTLTSCVFTASAPLPRFRVVTDSGLIYSGDGTTLAQLTGAGHVRALCGSLKGVDVFSNPGGHKALWHRLSGADPDSPGSSFTKCQTFHLLTGNGCVSGAAPISGKSRGGASVGRVVSPRGTSKRKGGTIRKAE